jgi:lipoprotein-releasing system permease protein
LVLIIGAAMAISFVATLYPSWQAARLDPVEAIRYE